MTNFRNLTMFALLALLSACGCGSNEDAVAMVQALSPNRLDQLAADLILAEASSSASKQFDERTGIPGAFQDLHPTKIVVDPVAGSRVYLSGCVDDKALIVMRSLGSGQHMMVLLPGEYQKEIVLWQSK